MRPSRWLILFLANTFIAAQVKSSQSADVIYAKSKAAVVTIFTFDAKRAPLTQGSGFLVSKGTVVTNYHVLAGSSSASVIFDDGTIAPMKTVVAASEAKDLALVEVDSGKRDPLVFGDELNLKIGDAVYAIGAPKGLTQSLSAGLVSAFRQENDQFIIQITTALAPGSSGGPLINSQGQAVGVTTSRLTDGAFGFAIGVGDVQRLLKAPFAVKLTLSDLSPEIAETAESDLVPIETLYNQEKYGDAQASFQKLSDVTKESFAGQLLLCKIAEKVKKYDAAIEACEAAIKLNPGSGASYAAKALALFELGDSERAEAAALKSTQLSHDPYPKTLLALIYYDEEKYESIPGQLPRDSSDPLILSMLAGSALHAKNYELMRQMIAKINAINPNNGWQAFLNGVQAFLDFKLDIALQQFRKCALDSTFIDAVCLLEAVHTEVISGERKAARSDIDAALKNYPKNHAVLTEAIFVALLSGDTAGAADLHTKMQLGGHREPDLSADCLYYYGMNQPATASESCAAALEKTDASRTDWSNAGYVALDNGRYDSAVTCFKKASELFYSSKDKHFAYEEIDLYWGFILAYYYSGDKKSAKKIYAELKKHYPEFITMPALKALPLVWSDTTAMLTGKVLADFK